MDYKLIDIPSNKLDVTINENIKESEKIIIVVSFFRELFGAGTITLPDGGAGYVLWSIPESWYAAGYENIGLLVLSPGAFIILGLVIWIQREFAGVEEDA